MKDIPTARLLEGRRLALQSAKRLLEAAEALTDGHSAGAVALFYHAVEEVGKATLIAGSSARGESLSINALRSHQTKWVEAQKVIAENMLVLQAGAFDPRVFDPRVFQVGENLSLEARDRRLYVDWDSPSETWLTPEEPSPDALREGILGVLGIVQQALERDDG